MTAIPHLNPFYEKLLNPVKETEEIQLRRVPVIDIVNMYRNSVVALSLNKEFVRVSRLIMTVVWATATIQVNSYGDGTLPTETLPVGLRINYDGKDLFSQPIACFANMIEYAIFWRFQQNTVLPAESMFSAVIDFEAMVPDGLDVLNYPLILYADNTAGCSQLDRWVFEGWTWGK